MALELKADGVFWVCLKESVDAATLSPAALERNVREKAKENSLAVMEGYIAVDGGVLLLRGGVGGGGVSVMWEWEGRKCGPLCAARAASTSIRRYPV